MKLVYQLLLLSFLAMHASAMDNARHGKPATNLHIRLSMGHLNEIPMNNTHISIIGLVTIFKNGGQPHAQHDKSADQQPLYQYGTNLPEDVDFGERDKQ